MRWVAILLLASVIGQHAFAAVDDRIMKAAGPNAPEIRRFLESAAERHGGFGARAAEFLVTNMPEPDLQSLSADFLNENLDLAIKARETFPWAKEVPEEIFFNDVLPYAVFDEPRDPWRADFFEKCSTLVKTCKTATEAAQTLNREFFNLVNVHYNLQRSFTNQSPKEAIADGAATCTGLTILLVDACRSVGVPARAAGIPKWPHKDGNHTWTEIWDGEWMFTGSDEYDPAGLNRGWFNGDANLAIEGEPEHAIHATSWKQTGAYFPMAWNPRKEGRNATGERVKVPSVNVTSRYKQTGAAEPEKAEISVRLHDGSAPGPDKRVVADVTLIDANGKIVARDQTRAGRADLNDMPRFEVDPGTTCLLRFTRDGESREASVEIKDPTRQTLDLHWDKLPPSSAAIMAVEEWLANPAGERGAAPEAPLTKAEAERIREMLWADRAATLQIERGDDLRAKKIPHGDFELRLLEKTFGEEPEGGHSLWISLHGGGGTTREVNDQQWHNQIQIYTIDEGYYVAPRSPTDTWNMWHQDHIDPLFDRLIEDYIVLRGVNPNKVYLLGYSAGGDGVYHLGPRLADRLAAASMMAGHPNDSSPLSLRNLPFAILMGADDSAYNRNTVAAEWGAALDELEKKDGRGGYPHFVRIFPNTGHGMRQQDAIALPWMAKFERNPWPKRIVWEQGNVPATRFYWLSLPGQQPQKGNRIDAEVDGQTIRLTSSDYSAATLRLSDELLDLDQPVTVFANGREVFSGKVSRNAAAIARSLEERADPASVAFVELPVEWTTAGPASSDVPPVEISNTSS